MEDILKAMATPVGVMLYACLFEWLRRRAARSKRASGEILRHHSYLFGRKLANWLRR
jgi:hypothetical protein